MAAIQYPLPTSPVISQPMVQVDASGNPVGRGATPMPAIQYPLPTSPVQATPVIQVDGSGNPVGSPNLNFFNIKDSQATGNGATDDTTAITTAITAAVAAGGGIVYFPAGTYITSGLTLPSNVILQGAGRMVTTIKLANGANTDVVQGANFGTLTGNGSFGGITAWSIRDLTIDGNRSNQTGASWGLRFYGYDFSLQNVTITNCFSDGIWSEWAYAGTFSYGTRTDSLESAYQSVKCCFNGGWGHHNRGPHDSIAASCIWFSNNQAGGTAGNLWVEDDNSGGQKYLAGAFQCLGCHAWGSSANWSVLADGTIIWAGGEIEGGVYGGLLVRATLTMSGSKVYYLNPTASTPGAGIQLGDDGSTSGAPSTFSYTSSKVRIASTSLDNFTSANRATAALAWVSCNKSEIDVHCVPPSVTVSVASNGQSITALTGNQLFVSSTAGFPATGTIYVQTSAGWAKCTYTSITGGGSPSFNGMAYVSGPGGTVATNNIVAGHPLGGTTIDPYSTVRIDGGTSGTNAIRPALSVQQNAGVTLFQAGVGINAFRVQGSTNTDILNINTSAIASPILQLVAMALGGYTANYATKTLAVDGTKGAIQPGTTAGVGSSLYSGSGAPTISASAGDFYFRLDTPSTANQRLYVCTGTTNWTAIL